MIYHAIGYLTHTINFTIPIIINQKTYIQSQCNVNLMFKMKKVNENNSLQKPLPVKEKRKKTSIKDEQVNDKLSALNDIAILLR